MTPDEAYALLDLRPGAAPDDIAKAWRRMAREAHPDRPGGDVARMTRINEARDILSGAAHVSPHPAPSRPAPPRPSEPIDRIAFDFSSPAAAMHLDLRCVSSLRRWARTERPGRFRKAPLPWLHVVSSLRRIHDRLIEIRVPTRAETGPNIILLPRIRFTGSGVQAWPADLSPVRLTFDKSRPNAVIDGRRLCENAPEGLEILFRFDGVSTEDIAATFRSRLPELARALKTRAASSSG